MMELRGLRYFLVVAQEQNITKAANILHITQPTLSRQLMQLEAELGTNLFVRDKKRLALTEAGLLFQKRAEEIVELSNKVEKEFHGISTLVGGQISIGAAETKAIELFPMIFSEFSQKYNEVTYNLFAGNTDDIKEKMDKGILELGILLEPVDVEKYHFIRLPEKERWGVLVSKESPLASQSHVTATDLIGFPILNTSRSIVQNELASWFGEHYPKLEIVATYNLISSITSLVEANFGTAICVEGSVSKRNYDSISFKPFHPELTTNCVLVWRKQKILSFAAEKFIESIRASIARDK